MKFDHSFFSIYFIQSIYLSEHKKNSLSLYFFLNLLSEINRKNNLQICINKNC